MTTRLALILFALLVLLIALDALLLGSVVFLSLARRGVDLLNSLAVWR